MENYINILWLIILYICLCLIILFLIIHRCISKIHKCIKMIIIHLFVSKMRKVDGGTGTNTLNVNNQGDSVGRGVNITPTAMTGLGSGINYSNLENINLNMGSGDDQVLAVATMTTSVFVDGGGGTNRFGQDFSNDTNGLNLTINLQNSALDGDMTYADVQEIQLILGVGDDTVTLTNLSVSSTTRVIVDGGGGTNIVNVNNQGDTVGRSVNIAEIAITGLPVAINYERVETMNLYLGSGNEIISADGTVTASVFVGGGGGMDSFVQDFSLRTDDLSLSVNLQDFEIGRAHV